MNKFNVLISIGDLHVFTKDYQVDAKSKKHAEELAYELAEQEVNDMNFSPDDEGWNECPFDHYNIQTEETKKVSKD